MTYHQITEIERYQIAALKGQGLNKAKIAQALGRNRSSIGRELKRNRTNRRGYSPRIAQKKANGRRRRSRKKQQFAPQDFWTVDALLIKQFSPEQISGYLRKEGALRISHETIYRHVWSDKAEGGSLYKHLRCAQKRRRKRYNSYDSRGRVTGKRHISERPAAAENRTHIGHWEIDTVMGKGDTHCIVTIVDRRTGYLLIGKLPARTTALTNECVIKLIEKHPGKFKTITSDNGTEFHGYKGIEAATNVPFYFATPHHYMGAGHKRKHERIDQTVLEKRKKHGRTDTGALQRDRQQAKHPSAEKTWLPNTGGTLLWKMTIVALQT